MGIFFRRVPNGVRGTAQVVSATGHEDRATKQRCRMQLVVQAEGVEATAVEHACLVSVDRWPQPGARLPVLVSRDDPSRLKVLWDEVPPHGDTAKADAEALAARLRGEQAAPSPSDEPQPDPELELLERLERLADLHASGALTDDEFDTAKARLLDQDR
jgi:hypothetical protein